ncbi:MAG: type II toxin-antitoxin system RelE/ParE family toxin [Desulfatirhabdiaceae bacterium]
MSNYEAAYEKLFVQNLKRYSAIRRNIKRRVERVLNDPYHNTEFLDDITGKLNLTGCRSARIDRNFRIIFVICEECRNMDECEYCFCEALSDQTVVFLTVGPHDKAYAIK